MKGKILFREEQSFVGTWTWYLMIFMVVVSTIPMILMVVNSDDMSEGFIGLAITLIVMGSIFALMTFCKLYTAIDTQSIYYRFPPFVNKERKLEKGNILSMEVRKYKPIWEYGGYGYRTRLKSGKALNVSGNQGLQLVLSNNKRLLIGTNKPDALKRAVEQLRLNWNNSDQDA